MAAQTQLSFCLDANAIIVVLLPRPDLLTLLAIITNIWIVQVEGFLKHFLAILSHKLDDHFLIRV